MAEVTRADIEALVRARIAEVTATDPAALTDATRFDEDLQADSLDLVEIVEGVEHDLRAWGVHGSLPEDELLAIRTVGDAVARLAALAGPESG